MIRYFNSALLILLFLSVLFSLHGRAQMINHYWKHSFNSTSSLIGGAVVAGDGDNSSIYYNPATIVEMRNGSNISFAANLFTWNVYKNFNALGTGNNLYNTNFQVQPQFVSFTYNPNKGKISYAFTVLTRTKEYYNTGFTGSKFVDIVNSMPGIEMYNTTFGYLNNYTDTWIGIGLGHELNEHLSYGATLFVSASSLNYHFSYAISAYNDSLNANNISSISLSTYYEGFKFYQYRLIAKLGIAYKNEKWKFGLAMTLPSVNVFTSGRSAERYEVQSNIRNKEGVLLSDYLIYDTQEKDQLKANFKYPFSVSFGLIKSFKMGDQKLYYSMEYFDGLQPYPMINAEINPDITSEEVYEGLENNNYLSFYYKADPVLNFAIGYSWKLKKNLTFLNAFRTDMTSVIDLNSEELHGYNYMKTANYNVYHYSAGLNFNFKNNNIIMGGEFSFGFNKNQEQIANFNNPVEYDPQTGIALQGPIEDNVDLKYFGVNLYISATLNFFSGK